MTATATTATLENVLYEKKGAIAYVSVNRPKVLNALNAQTLRELKAAFEDARQDDEGRRWTSGHTIGSLPCVKTIGSDLHHLEWASPDTTQTSRIE